MSFCCDPASRFLRFSLKEVNGWYQSHRVCVEDDKSILPKPRSMSRSVVNKRAIDEEN